MSTSQAGRRRKASLSWDVTPDFKGDYRCFPRKDKGILCDFNSVQKITVYLLEGWKSRFQKSYLKETFPLIVSPA